MPLTYLRRYCVSMQYTDCQLGMTIPSHKPNSNHVTVIYKCTSVSNIRDILVFTLTACISHPSTVTFIVRAKPCSFLTNTLPTVALCRAVTKVSVITLCCKKNNEICYVSFLILNYSNKANLNKCVIYYDNFSESGLIIEV